MIFGGQPGSGLHALFTGSILLETGAQVNFTTAVALTFCAGWQCRWLRGTVGTWRSADPAPEPGGEDELSRFLTIFDQGRAVAGRDNHVLGIEEGGYPARWGFVLRQLQRAMAEEEVRRYGATAPAGSWHS